MTHKSYDTPLDVELFHDEGRRQDDIQEHVSKFISSRIDAILSTNNPRAAGKFNTIDYVLVPADQLILRAAIMKLNELLENMSDMDRRIKAHVITLFHLWSDTRTRVVLIVWWRWEGRGVPAFTRSMQLLTRIFPTFFLPIT